MESTISLDFIDFESILITFLIGKLLPDQQKLGYPPIDRSILGNIVEAINVLDEFKLSFLLCVFARLRII